MSSIIDGNAIKGANPVRILGEGEHREHRDAPQTLFARAGLSLSDSERLRRIEEKLDRLLAREVTP